MFQNQYTQPDFRPSSGHITYTRWMGANYLVHGEIVGEREVKVRRYNATVTEYLVKPAPGVTNMSKHIVDESDVVKIETACPRCNGAGHIAIVGDNDVPCPVCGVIDADEVF